MSENAPPAAPEALVAAALLEQGRAIHIASLALGLGVAILAPHGANGLLTVIVCAAAVAALLTEIYVAIRVGFDAKLFRAVGDGRMDLASLDETLAAFGLAPCTKAGRSLKERLAGAMRLFRMQAICAIVLAGSFSIAMSVALWRGGVF